MEPTTAADWMIIAKERLADAEAILKERPDSVASVYMAGYAIECTRAFAKTRHCLSELW